MTKTALIIIAVLLIIPVLVGLYAYRKWENNNIVVAHYGETVDEVIYGSSVLKRIGGAENYTFRKGEYLGKIDDRFFGSQLYRVADDESGDYFAVAGSDGLVLMSETGTMTDGMRGKNSRVTRAVFGDYLAVTEVPEEIALITGSISGDGFTVKPADYKPGKLMCFTLHVCLDDSAVSTETAGRFWYIAEKNKWVFTEDSGPAESTGEEETEPEETEAADVSYDGTEVSNPSLLRLLKRLVLKEEEQPKTSAVQE